jgi:uncharacterized protein (DUF302 family)
MDTYQTARLTVERLSFHSERPFESVLGSIRQGIGHPDPDDLWATIRGEESFEKVEGVVQAAVGPTGLMAFGEFDDGRFIRKDRGDGTPSAGRLQVGNPLIMKRMAELAPDAAAYVPVTILVDELGGKVQVSYDRMASLLSAYTDSGATRIAKDLDAKVESLIRLAIALSFGTPLDVPFSC